MRSIIAIAALAGLSAAQNLDTAAIQKAPPPAKTEAPMAAVSDSVSHSPAMASAVGAGAVPLAQRRSLRKRATSTTSVTSTPTTMSTAASSSATSTSSSVTTTTVTTGTTTTSSLTSSSTSACPTTPEPGTYCGFINPEDPCAPQPDGFGPAILKPDTVAAFQAYQLFHSQAQQASDPDAAYVRTFSDLSAGVSQNSYLGLHTLSSYDVQGCSKLCDATDLCTSFNIYIERDPSLNPAGNCKMPPSITNYKCTLWGSGLQAVAASNAGGYRGDFPVVIVGSNGFDKTSNTVPPTPAGFGAPQRCSNGAVNNAAISVGNQFFPGPYDLNLCAGFASAYNDADMQSAASKGSKQAVALNAYNVYKNGVAQGIYCALYSQTVDCSQANYQPGDMNGNYMTVQNSFILNVPAKQISSSSSSSTSTSQSASATASVVTTTESTTSTSVANRQDAQGTSTTPTSTVTPSSSISSSSASTSASQSSTSTGKTTTPSSSATPSSSSSSSSSASPTQVSTTTATSTKSSPAATSTQGENSGNSNDNSGKSGNGNGNGGGS